MLHASSTPSPEAPGAPGRLLPLRLEGVSYEVGGRALIRDVHCELRAGIRTVLLGPNGAGKSLLLRLCHGLLRPTAGRIVWNGEPAERGAQAMVFQRPVMLRRSALANVEYALALKGLSRRERRRTALQFLERTGLARLAARSARVLSVAPGRWGRGCCSSTSPPPAWIRRPARRWRS